MMNVADNWTESLESGDQIDVKYKDFEKAFGKDPTWKIVM